MNSGFPVDPTLLSLQSDPVASIFQHPGSANTIRRTAITYPDGRVLDYGHGATDGINDRLSRVESLTIQGEAQAAVNYTYGGVARYLKIQYPEPGVQLSYLKTASQPLGDGGNHYTGYDRFGRVVCMRWVTTSGGAERDRFQWGFDRANNRTWRRNVVAITGYDDRYHYDGLYQVTARQQGSLTLDQAAVGGVPAEAEAFAYDPTGNCRTASRYALERGFASLHPPLSASAPFQWRGYRKDEAGATVLDQERKNNRDNQIVQFGGSGAGVSYDKAGNALRVPPTRLGDWAQHYRLTWDAWNRLVRVQTDDEFAPPVAEYAYDGAFRRITVSNGILTIGTYYNDLWRPVEERLEGQSDPQRQYVWGARPGHRDELILRDRDTGGGSLDERLYCLMDYFDPTAVIDPSGAVVERYGWSAFGQRRVMDAEWAPLASSAVAFDFGFHGQFLDSDTGYYNYGYRYYSPEIGRWLSRDPIGEASQTNLYSYSRTNPINSNDLLGLISHDAAIAHAVERGTVSHYPSIENYPFAIECDGCSISAKFSVFIGGYWNPPDNPAETLFGIAYNLEFRFHCEETAGKKYAYHIVQFVSDTFGNWHDRFEPIYTEGGLVIGGPWKVDCASCPNKRPYVDEHSGGFAGAGPDSAWISDYPAHTKRHIQELKGVGKKVITCLARDCGENTVDSEAKPELLGCIGPFGFTGSEEAQSFQARSGAPLNFAETAPIPFNCFANTGFAAPLRTALNNRLGIG